MDLKVYYQKLRQIEAGIAARDVVMVSLETPDGGKAGVKTEVTRETAARLILENRARPATEAEAAAYQREAAEKRRLAEQAAAANRLQVTVLTEADLRTLKGPARAQKP
jgi:molybdenum-dependent DNA-binding transcriptional regulator ModE